MISCLENVRYVMIPTEYFLWGFDFRIGVDVRFVITSDKPI